MATIPEATNAARNSRQDIITRDPRNGEVPEGLERDTG